MSGVKDRLRKTLALPMAERLALKQALKKLEGTTILQMMESSGLV